MGSKIKAHSLLTVVILDRPCGGLFFIPKFSLEKIYSSVNCLQTARDKQNVKFLLLKIYIYQDVELFVFTIYPNKALKQ